MSKQEEKNNQPTKKKNWKKRFLWFVIGLLSLPFLLSLILHIPYVQTKVKDYAARSLSKELLVDVSIGGVDFSMFKGVMLEDLDMRDDSISILSTKELNVGLAESLLSLASGSLKINTIQLNSPVINLIIDSENRKTNLVTILRRLSSEKPKTEKESNPLDLSLKNVGIDNLQLTLDNRLEGSYLEVNSAHLLLTLNKIDTKNALYDINSLLLEKPIIRIKESFAEQTIDAEVDGEVVNEKVIEGVSEMSKKRGLQLLINCFEISNGVIQRQSYKTNIRSMFDVNNFNLSNIDVAITDLDFDEQKTDVKLNLKTFKFNDEKGFELIKLTSDSIHLTDRAIELPFFEMKTNSSYINAPTRLTYSDLSDFNQFVEKVRMDAKFNNSEISVKDAFYFVKGARDIKFYKENKNKVIKISGHYRGEIDNFKGDNVRLTIPGIVDINGNFSTKKLSKPKDLFIILRLKKLNTSMENLKKLIPGFNPPQNFYKLGDIEYTGNFDGFLSNFTTDGLLSTELGVADLDLSLSTGKDNKEATYTGQINLQNFDLQKWSDNDDFGLVSLQAEVEQGRGLTLNTASADLRTTLQSFTYRGYNYSNINLDGTLNKNTFDGIFKSTDPNINLDFEGKLDLNNEKYTYKFFADIKNLDLNQLNLSKDVLNMRGQIEVDGTGNSVANILGEVKTSNLEVNFRDTIRKFDTIYLKSFIDQAGSKNVNFVVEDSKINLRGDFDPLSIVNDLQYVIQKNFPYHTSSWKFDGEQSANIQNLTFDVEIGKSRKIFDLLGVDVDVTDLRSKGYFNSEQDFLTLTGYLPELIIRNNRVFNTSINLESRQENGRLSMHIDSSMLSNRKFRAVDVITIVRGDSTYVNIDTKEVIDSVDNISIETLITPYDNAGYSMQFRGTTLELYGKKWKINPDNKIDYKSEYINIENLEFTDGNRFISIDDVYNKGLMVNTKRFDVEAINPLLDYDKMYFTGEATTNLRITNIFEKSPEVLGHLQIPNLIINGDDFGTLAADILKPKDQKIEALLTLAKPDINQSFKANATYDFDTKELDAIVKARDLTMKWLEYIIPNGISNVKGRTDLDARIFGVGSDIKIDGDGLLTYGEVRIDYIGETFHWENQKLKLTDRVIDLTGGILLDSENNQGLITGGLQHKLFKDFGVNANITGENVIALNTTKFDNSVYYGKGQGDISVDFTGSDINNVLMTVNATTGPGTVLNVPIKSTQSTISESFITFINKESFLNEKENESSNINLDGISIDMNISITQEAEMRLIFDEVNGDVITGFGNGNINVELPKNGDFTIYGDYVIDRGNYKFTALRTIIAKDFEVRRGGTVKWTGDPVNAELNILADYGVRTNLSSLISEYLNNENLQRAAAKATEVNLTLLIGNTLYDPSINFDISFPDLVGELKSYADTKIRILKSNEVDLNGQVFGLMVFNSFIPSNTLSEIFATNNVLSSATSLGINTVSEMLSSQLSLFVTSYINQSLEDNGLLSGIDFDLSLRNNTSFQGVQSGNNGALFSEIEVRLKPQFRFLDERLSFDIGGNYVRQSLVGIQDYVVPEFVVQYALTADRKVNLRLYGKYDLDEVAITSRRQRYGFGLRYRTEFGPMLETETNIADYFKETIKQVE